MEETSLLCFPQGDDQLMVKNSENQAVGQGLPGS